VSHALSTRRLAAAAGMMVIAALAVAMLIPVDALAGEIVSIGKNARNEVVGTVGQLFVAALVCVAVMLYWRRHYSELMVTAVVGAIVAWVVFSPDAVAHKLQDIAAEIFSVDKKVR
jgi:hypothetical protein